MMSVSPETCPLLPQKPKQTNVKACGYNEHNYTHNIHLFNYNTVIEQ